MNILDVAVLVWAGLAAVSGYRRGAALQLTEYAGLLAGLLVGAVFAPPLARLFTSPVAQAVAALGVLVGLAAIGEGLGWVIGRRVWAAARRSVLGPLDAVAGSVVSVLAVLLVTWFLSYSLSAGPFPSLSRQIRSSALVGALDDVLPRPPSLLAEVRGFLDRFGFPEVFADVPPLPAGPVQGPSSALVAQISAKANPSVVQIVSQACGAIRSGSGFVAADHYVVTNAHVVAGASDPHVRIHRSSYAATTVLFDPKLDLAVLYVSGSPGPVLALDPHRVDRGTQGAVIGYPGGGPRQDVSGAVRRTLDAVGRDIYGRSIVSRTIYEMQAEVLPGDSGGPFVLKDGEVAGVIFAASTTDPNVGYALTSDEVLAEVSPVVGSTKAVSTQGCSP
jgi:S1-C subfamily serine protease